MPPKEIKPEEPAPGASKPFKALSVFFDEDGKPLNSDEASGRPILRIAKEGTIILGPNPPAIDFTTHIRVDDGKRTSYQVPPHMLSGHTPTAPASDGQTSSQSVGFDDPRVILETIHRHQAELQCAQVDPPKLPMLSSLCTSNLGVVRHLHDLQKYFIKYDSRFPDSTPSGPQWWVGQANRAIAKVDAYHYWSLVTGTTCVSWEGWCDEFKKKALSPNWESETRRVFEGLQCQGFTLAAWTAFEEKAGECQMVLSDCIGPSPNPTCVENSCLASPRISLPMLRIALKTEALRLASYPS
ncbi:hypothetical protein L198_06292 [Cryptococcus wingfieldii CBS 7118]|uniref:Uncharacterized protein n=1 Tax=Cryptococcus wingfieldii CBS 7118 TaxID=1295528 RepID=A0A1E3IMF8_9TREE|nr:hypothetical protein L198_06292 [Cryptococcus wingfieldii CBS 7118]ODN89605.1 hypothetical protein L198_06292 [Cryptococcus wingfieldii CBS 7118]